MRGPARFVCSDQARSAAFAEADVDGLDDVYDAGSPALARDSELLGQLRASGRQQFLLPARNATALENRAQ